MTKLPAKIKAMGRPRKQAQQTPEQLIDGLALRIRERLFKSWSRNVEQFIAKFDQIMAAADASQVGLDPRVAARHAELPSPAVFRAAQGSVQRKPRACRNCRQTGHRADKCPNPKSDGEDSEGEPARAPARALTQDETYVLIQAVQGADEKAARRAMDELVRKNIGLVHYWAHKFSWMGMAYEDIVQEGAMGLMKGIRKFDTTRGLKLSTYVVWWIRHYIIRANENGAMIRLPARYGGMLYKITKTQLDLEDKLKRAPSVEELSAATKVSVADINRLRNRGHVSTSLDQVMGEDGETTLHSWLSDGAPTAAEDMERIQAQMTVHDKLAELPSREAAILRLRYLDGDGLTLREVGDMIDSQNGTRTGISRERVRQIEQGALKKLRARFPRAA